MDIKFMRAALREAEKAEILDETPVGAVIVRDGKIIARGGNRRETKKNALNAYAAISSKWKFLGYLTFLVPALIMTYYSVIGGWIVKYLTAYVVSGTEAPAQDGYFTSFITSTAAPIVFMFIFFFSFLPNIL